MCTNPSNALAKAGKRTALVYAKAEKRLMSILTEQPDAWQLIVLSGSTEGIITAITNGARVGEGLARISTASYEAWSDDDDDLDLPLPRPAPISRGGGGETTSASSSLPSSLLPTSSSPSSSPPSYDGRILCLSGYHPCVTEIAERWPSQYGVPLALTHCEASLPAVESALTGSETPFSAIFITQVASLSGRIADCGAIATAFKHSNPNGLVVIDGTQAVGKIPVIVEETGADVYIFSGHKFGALKGVGGMLLRQSVLPRWMPLVPGSQQGGLRGGTLNVQGLFSMDLALCDATTSLPSKIAKTRACIEKICSLLDGLRLPRVRILAPTRDGLYTWNTILITVPLCSRRIASELSKLGYDVGIGTACQTQSGGGAEEEDPAKRSPFQIRISMVPGQTVDEEKFVSAIRKSYRRVLRAALASSTLA